MILATIIIPVGVVGLFAGCEYLMARHSKRDVLSQKFRNTSIPPNGWRGCRFLQLEVSRTSYGEIEIESSRFEEMAADSQPNQR